MYKQFAICGSEVTVKCAIPRFAGITFPDDHEYTGKNWLWAEIGDLNNAVQNALCREGYRDSNRWVTQYHTFFPVTKSDGPHFHWVIITALGEKIPCKGDIMHCPFPNVPRQANVERYRMLDGDHLMVPKNWALEILQLSRTGTTEIGCTMGDDGDRYWKKTFKSNELRVIGAESVFGLGYYQNQSAH